MNERKIEFSKSSSILACFQDCDKFSSTLSILNSHQLLSQMYLNALLCLYPTDVSNVLNEPSLPWAAPTVVLNITKCSLEPILTPTDVSDVMNEPSAPWAALTVVLNVSNCSLGPLLSPIDVSNVLNEPSAPWAALTMVSNVTKCSLGPLLSLTDVYNGLNEPSASWEVVLNVNKRSLGPLLCPTDVLNGLNEPSAPWSALTVVSNVSKCFDVSDVLNEPYAPWAALTVVRGTPTSANPTFNVITTKVNNKHTRVVILRLNSLQYLTKIVLLQTRISKNSYSSSLELEILVLQFTYR